MIQAMDFWMILLGLFLIADVFYFVFTRPHEYEKLNEDVAPSMSHPKSVEEREN